MRLTVLWLSPSFLLLLLPPSLLPSTHPLSPYHAGTLTTSSIYLWIPLPSQRSSVQPEKRRKWQPKQGDMWKRKRTKRKSLGTNPNTETSYSHTLSLWLSKEYSLTCSLLHDAFATWIKHWRSWLEIKNWKKINDAKNVGLPIWPLNHCASKVIKSFGKGMIKQSSTIFTLGSKRSPGDLYVTILAQPFYNQTWVSCLPAAVPWLVLQTRPNQPHTPSLCMILKVVRAGVCWVWVARLL